VALSSSMFALGFKSPLRCLCQSFYSSRNRWRDRAKRQRELNEQMRERLCKLQQDNQAIERELARRRLQDKTRTEAIRPLPQWSNLPSHKFSAEIIALCCQLSLLIGFRAVPKVLECIFKAFALPLQVPSRDIIRNWSCRNGVAILQQVEPADDWVWMIDHSVQLGKMFVLVVLGIRSSDVPQGRALRRKDMTPLAVLPTNSRNKEEVGHQLTQLTEQIGTPIAILSDGACELHEGAQQLKTKGFTGVHLDDIKHKVSNLLKKVLGGDERFKAFSANLGKTKALIQQTELEHLLPPRKKEKCRFMNVDRIIDWATMVEHQLTLAAGVNSSEAERLMDKLGWLTEFTDDLQVWRECRQVIGVVLRYANEQGVFTGATELLRTELSKCATESELAQFLVQKMIACYQSNEEQLVVLSQPSIRLPCSTEVLESAFGGFKALQRHHGQGTFTSLLACFATLLDECDAKKIRERFTRVSNKGLKSWLKDSGLTNSTQSRRTKAYAQVPMNSTSVTAFSTA
jgi:hypothetical protein